MSCTLLYVVVGRDHLRRATVCQRASAPSRLLVRGTWHEQSAVNSTGVARNLPSALVAPLLYLIR